MLVLAAELEPVVENRPQPLPLDVLHADEHLLVINKPAGLVVHPAAGHPDGTLVNGLLYHYPELEALPRAGLVHRLDKDTTGVMRSEEHTCELQSRGHLVCRLLL